MAEIILTKAKKHTKYSILDFISNEKLKVFGEKVLNSKFNGLIRSYQRYKKMLHFYLMYFRKNLNKETFSDDVSCLKNFESIVLVGTNDGWVQIYDTLKDIIDSPFPKEHSDVVQCIEFPEHQREIHRIFFSGSKDKLIKVWDFTTAKPLGTLKGHEHTVVCLLPITSSVGEKLLISGSYDRSVRIWCYTEFKQLKVIDECVDYIKSLFISTSKINIISDNTKENTENNEGQESKEISIKGKEPSEYLICLTRRLNLFLFDENTGQTVQKVKIQTEKPIEYSNSIILEWNTNDKVIAYADYEGIIVFHDIQQEKVLKRLNGHTKPVNFMTFFHLTSNKNQLLVTVGWDYLMNFWNYKRGDLIYSIKTEINAFGCLIEDTNNMYRMITANGKRLNLWNVDTSLIKKIK